MNDQNTNISSAPTLFDISEQNSDNVVGFTSTLRQLKRSIDPRMVRHRAGMADRDGRVQTVEYVEWHTVADILDEAAPNWSHTVKDIRAIGDIVTVVVAITINGITREGVGTGRIRSEMGIKKAEHDALKRAAVKFGIARELYKKELETSSDNAPDAETDKLQPREPFASTVGSLVTAKQLGMIKAIGRAANIDTHHECRSRMKCNVDELSKYSASTFIDHLREMQRQRSTIMRRAS